MSFLISVKPAWTNKGRTGPVYRYLDIEWFACEGMIVLMDNRIECPEDARVTVVTAGDFAVRTLYFEQMKAARSRIKYPWQRQKLQLLAKATADMAAATQDAQRMGDPDDPEVQRWWRVHYNKGTPAKLPGTETDAAGYSQALRELDKELREMGIDPKTLRTAPVRPRRRIKL